MNLILDTHLVLWWLTDDERMGSDARSAIADPENTIFLSAVVLWEIRLKQALGKLVVPEQLREILDEQGFVELPIQLDHVDRLSQLPDIHRDPFDRLLIAQAHFTGFMLATRDSTIRQYEVQLFPPS